MPLRSTALLLAVVALGMGCHALYTAGEPWDRLQRTPSVLIAPPRTLAFASYNTFLRPGVVSRGDYPVARAHRIAEALHTLDADVVALQEVWHGDALRALAEGTRAAYPHRLVRKPTRGLLEVSGGLALLSRWPIVATRTLEYDACRGLDDCRAAKGALYARVRVGPDAFVQVVTTHLDAGATPGDRAARAAQLAELRALLETLDPAAGPLVLLGDFNVDALADPEEHARLLATLAVEDAAVSPPSTTNGTGSRGLSCDAPPDAKRLDYVLARAADPRLAHSATRHLPLATPPIGGRVCYLSDHRLVAATFTTQFDDARPPPCRG